MQLSINRTTIQVSDAEVAEIVRRHLLSDSRERTESVVSRIGAEWNGGLYAGLTLVDNDPAELVLLPEEFKGKWDDAVKWAEQKGGVLPSRIDQLVLLKNLKAEFKPEWYWSGEQHASGASGAWLQDFVDGYQYGVHKDYEGRARAVRRLKI